jgi:hypothetical protein
MRRLQKAEKAEIRERTETVLEALLRFKVSYDLRRHMGDKTISEWSDYAASLHNSYPITGTGIRTTPAILTAETRDLSQFIIEEVGLSPETAVEEFDAFPMAAASAAYVFSLLEDYGNTVALLIDPTSVGDRQAWHRKVRGDPAVRPEVHRAREGFAEAFGAAPRKVRTRPVKRLMRMKLQRNAYAHDLETYLDFEDFFNSVVVVLCQIAYLASPTQPEISVYPFEDFDEQFGPDTPLASRRRRK